MYERRRIKRRHLIYYLQVFDNDTDTLIGHLVDITSEGIMLISEDPIPMNKTYNLKMMLPSRMGGRESWIFEAESRWSQKDINPDFYDIGFLLREVDRHSLRVIEDLIQGFGFQD
jgi:hypothetical protein